MMSGLGRFFLKLVIITGLIFIMLSIYGVFSFSYGFASTNGPSSGWEVLTFESIRMWKDLFNADHYFFVAITDTGKAYLGNGTTDDIATMTGILYVARRSSYSEISVAWWFVFPIVSFIVLIIPGPRERKELISASEPSPTPTKPLTPAPKPIASSVKPEAASTKPMTTPTPKKAESSPKVLTSDEKSAKAERRSRVALIWGLTGTLVVSAIIITVVLVNANKENSKEQTAVGSSLAPEGRHPYVLGSQNSPITSGATISNALQNHSVLDVYYYFVNRQDSVITLPTNVSDVVFYCTSSSSNYLSFSMEDHRTNALTLGLHNVRAEDTLFDTQASFALTIKYAGNNSFSYPYELGATYSSFALFKLPNADLTFIAAEDDSTIRMTTKAGSRGQDGNNGENPTTNEATCNGSDGTDGTSTAGGIWAKSVVLENSTINSSINVSTGSAGNGGNGGKHGWYFGVLGIGSHDGRDGTPGDGGQAGYAIKTKDSTVMCDGTSKTIGSGSLGANEYSFSTGSDGRRGGINS